MTDVKTYSSKSNAARAFKARYTDVPGDVLGMTSSQLTEAGYIDEDSPGKWVLNDPATLAGHEAEDFEMSQEELERQAGRPDRAREALEVVAAANVAAAKPAPQPQQALEVSNLSLPKSGRDGKCPHCGKSTRDGDRVTEFQEMSPGSQATTDHQFTCNECAGEWGPAVEKTRKSRAPKVRSSLVSPVKFMWDMLDAEPGLARKEAVRRGIEAGVSPNTAATQFQWWRKARGLVAPK
jgi:hypothetical protein